MHILHELSHRYPQLCLPICAGERLTEEYRNAVLRGIPTERTPAFSFSADDRLEPFSTEVGPVEVLTLVQREDFEHAFRALAHRCEPVELPASVGAVFISGLINWEKLNRHMDDYERSGGEDYDGEFRRFTADKKNYTDSIILLSSGYYSAVRPEAAGFSPETWLEASLTIRKYHELTHFICRRLCPQDISSVRDEIVADAVGLWAAFGRYDARLARLFLGIESGSCGEGARLLSYPDGDAPDAAEKASALIDGLTEQLSPLENIEPFDTLRFILSKYYKETR